MRGGRAAELVALLILALGTWLGFATAGPPRVVTSSAPATAFSAERAMHDLQVIAASPHATGSVQHDRVRDFLIDRLRALGLDDVHVQSATGFNTLDGPLAATVANVVGRKPGRHPGRAILLSAHYDAVPRSFGAGDDGVGVAAILGTVAALADSPPLDHDIIVTFVDAEEDGLLGTEAFVNLHPWARDVSVVLNFDGRGNTGPVYMFQASPGNAPLIEALARVDGARTNSLTGEVYRHLPSDTDLSIWLHSAFAVGALNFAHVGGYQRYHTPIDNLASFDPRILQQMGDYALSLTRTFGNADLTQLRTTDAIYFNAPLLGVIRYPGSWALFLAIAALGLVLVVIALGMSHRVITLAGIGRGSVALLVTLLLPTLTVLAGWQVIRLVHPGYREILQRDPYNSLWYLLASGAFTVAVAVEVQRRFGEGHDDSHGSAGTAVALATTPLLLWGILGVVVAWMLPGASYLFAWPLLATTLCALCWWRDLRHERVPSALLMICAVPVVVLWTPLVESLEVGLTADVLPLCSLLLALMLTLLALPLQLTGGTRRWIVRGALAVTVTALVVAEATSSFTTARKRPDSLAYLVDADSAKAWWVSFDHGLDRWTAAALGPHPTRRSFATYGLTQGTETLLAAQAGLPVVPACPVHVLRTDSVAGGRRIHLHVDRTGDGETLAIFVDSTVAVSQLVINGRILADGGDDRYSPRYHRKADDAVLRYFGVPPEGVDLWLTVSGPATQLRVLTGVEELPATPSGPLPPRPDDVMSKPFVATDMTLNLWRITP